MASFLGGESMPSRAVVPSPGYGYGLKAERLNDEFEHDRPLADLLLRYTQALIAQIGQIAACNRHHTPEQRLCRWILPRLDRLPSNELTMTQGLIAAMLGVRRVGVTQAAGRLQEAGLIHCSRGHIAYSIALDWMHEHTSAMRPSNGSMTVCSPRKTPMAMLACTARVAGIVASVKSSRTPK